MARRPSTPREPREPKVIVPTCNTCKKAPTDGVLYPWGRNDFCLICLPEAQEGRARMALARQLVNIELDQLDRDALTLFPHPSSCFYRESA